MVSLVLQTPSVSFSDTLAEQIQLCLAELKSETSTQKLAIDTKNKMKDILALLSEYIIENTANADKAALLKGIDKLLNSITSETEAFHAVKSLISLVAAYPESWNESLLAMLQGLVTDLKNV